MRRRRAPGFGWWQHCEFDRWADFLVCIPPRNSFDASAVFSMAVDDPQFLRDRRVFSFFGRWEYRRLGGRDRRISSRVAVEDWAHASGHRYVRAIYVDRAARNAAVSSSDGARTMEAREETFDGAVFRPRHSLVRSRTI